jgi:hypothetical protein
MRIASGVCITLCLATGLGAQIRGVGSVVNPAGGAGTPGVTRTIPSVVNPAGGVPRPVIPGGRGIGNGVSRAPLVYFYPVYFGGGYYSTPYVAQDDSGAYGPAQQAQSSGAADATPQQPVAPVIINLYYPPASQANPGTAGDQPQPSPAPSTANSEPDHYLIAFKDHAIYSATAFWVEGDTLHYFTSGNIHNQASLSLVDRDFTERLNKEAGVEVKLPASAK